MVTEAWDESGANFVSDRDITIYSSTPGETCPASTGTMNVCLPTQNETTTTSLHVFANAASSGEQMTSVQVYIDGSLIYNDTSGATYLDTALTVKPGPTPLWSRRGMRAGTRIRSCGGSRHSE